MSATVETTTPQCMTALQKANATRLAAAVMKRHVKAGTMPLEVALAHRDAQSITVGTLLECVPRWGTHKVETLLRRVPISAHRKVRDVTDRERARIVALMFPVPDTGPRTDVEVVQWRTSPTRVSRRHAAVPGAPRALCGSKVMHGRLLREVDASDEFCRQCRKAARW
jgi:hypothetical protein